MRRVTEGGKRYSMRGIVDKDCVRVHMVVENGSKEEVVVAFLCGRGKERTGHLSVLKKVRAADLSSS